MNNQPINSKLRSVWRTLLTLSDSDQGDQRSTSSEADELTTSELHKLFQDDDHQLRQFVELYRPLCRDQRQNFVVAHLGQSLDGRIAAANGSSRWVTDQEDVVHNHRMRALFDVVIVGAGTVRHDDPQLTVREVEGPSPIRVVIDAKRRLGASFKLFNDGEAPTLLLCAMDEVRGDRHHGQAEIHGIESIDGRLLPSAILRTLASLGLTRVFIEGGGLTISQFLQEGCLDRLQIAVAPVIIGSGRPSISLPEIDDVAAALRPKVRNFNLGPDVLFECCFDESD